MELVTVKKEVRINKCRNSVRLPIQLFESTNKKTLGVEVKKEKLLTVNNVILI